MVWALIYHHISPRERDSFLRQLDFIASVGPLRPHGLLGAKRGVLVSFDDGWTSLLWAHGRMREFGIPAVLFLTTRLPGLRKEGSWQSFVVAKFPRMASRYGRELVPLSWDELRGLVGEGLVVGSHTHNHTRVLPGIPLRELAHPRILIRDELGQEARLFAYPYGRRRDLCPRLAPLLIYSGYELAFTGHGLPITPLSHPLFLPRVYVDPTWSPEELAGRLSLGLAVREGAAWLLQKPKDR